MTLTKVCMIAVLGIAVTMIVKQWKSDLLILIRLSLVLVLGTILIGAATPLFSYFQELTQYTKGIAHTELLFKALGIALLTEICANICKECGESSLATGVELTGKIEILLLALPMISEILEIAEGLLSMGGEA